MDQRYVKFLSIVENGSFTKAAKSLRVSQPGLSMAMAQLEKELGVVLFHRKGRRNELTPAGVIVYEQALKMRSDQSALQRLLETHKSGKPLLRVGMIDSLADLLFVQDDLLHRLAKSTDVSLVVNSSSSLLTEMSKDQLDVALIVDSELVRSSRFSIREVGSEALCMVGAPDFLSRLNSYESIPFIAYNQQATTHRIVESALVKIGRSRRVVMRSTNPEVMLHLCLDGVGSTVLPGSTVQRYVLSGQLSSMNELYGLSIYRPIVALTHNSAEIDGINEIINSAKGTLFHQS